MTRILTGIQASGVVHWGNYFGMMKPAIDLQADASNDCFYFIADQHAFTSLKNADKFSQYQKDTVLDWLAMGMDPTKATFYRQSDVPAHTEMAWYLSCFAGMGLLERAHSYKDKKSKGLDTNVGLFTYPILMTADILLYDAQKIPVGKDQKQHVEIARDIAQKINHHYDKEIFVLPEPVISADVQTVPGVDGDKMSKSYGNTITLFEDEKTLKKKIMSLKTDSKEMGESLDPDTCLVFGFHQLFGNPNIAELQKQYQEGSIGYGGSKKMLLELVLDYFATARAKREVLAHDPAMVETILKQGAIKANTIANEKLAIMRQALGLSARPIMS